MELTTSQDVLVRGLQKIQGIVERKNTLPILSHFLLSAQHDSAVIHATDLELGYKGQFETTVNKPGTATLPARKMYDILRELPAGESVILSVETQGWAHIKAGSATFKVPCLPAEEYPALPPIEDADFTAIEYDVLDEMIRRTTFATSHDETRYTLSGVLVVCHGSELTMVATDGHRLAHIKRPVSLGKELQVIVPRKALDEVLRFASDSDDKEISVASLENHLVFRRGQSTLVTRLIEGQFPDYAGVIPKEFARRASVEHDRLLRALRRVSLLSNEKTRPVKIEFERDALTLRSNTPEMGEAVEQIPAEYDGEAMDMGFNARYLLEALGAMTTDQLVIELNDPLSPGVIRPREDHDYFYVVMPMRVCSGCRMLIERLVLRQFRNYKETSVAFAPGGAYISGPNGSGKTNLLEAIYYLANHVSFRTQRREELQTWNAAHSVIEARVMRRAQQQQSELAVQLTPNGRRLLFNGKETKDVRRFTAHIAAVAFHPGTMTVIKGGPAGRRYLIDRGLYSLQPEFGQLSQQFQRALKQRNALLRNAAQHASSNLGVWTDHFIDAAVRLMHYRQAHVDCLNAALAGLSQELGEDVGRVSLEYRPAIFAKVAAYENRAAGWEDDMRLQAQCRAEAQRLQRAEEAMGQTLFGPQRDDCVIRFRGRESRGYASQGEQRLAAFLLVAALSLEIYRQRGHYPVILLDDVISELDERHRQVIFDFLKAYSFQVFITDVEDRPRYRELSALTPLRVRQIGGWADIGSVETARDVSDDPRPPRGE